MKLSELGSMLSGVAPAFLDEADSGVKMPYSVYTAYRKNHAYADNKPIDGAWRVQVDYWTRNKVDPNASIIEELLEMHEVPYKHMRTWDKDMKAVHHIYGCEGVRDG